MSIEQIKNDIVNAFDGNSLKNKIVDGIKTATQKLGVKLVNEEWGSKDYNGKWDCACALGCVLLANNLPLQGEDEVEQNDALAADFLGVDTHWVESFITGFDDGFRKDDLNSDAFELGVALRQEYLSPKEEDEESEDDSY